MANEQDPPGDLKVFSLGLKGVNTTDDPLHTEVGDIASGINAVFRGSGTYGGLYKRGGLRLLNNDTFNGSLLSIFAAPFSDPTPGAILFDDTGLTLTDDVFLVLVE